MYLKVFRYDTDKVANVGNIIQNEIKKFDYIFVLELSQDVCFFFYFFFNLSVYFGIICLVFFDGFSF